jgi:hypothetical protein
VVQQSRLSDIGPPALLLLLLWLFEPLRENILLKERRLQCIRQGLGTIFMCFFSSHLIYATS